MSAKPAIVTQRDVTRILKGAAAAGISLSVVVKDGEARFVPVDQLAVAEAPLPIEAWRAQRNARKAGGRA